MIQPTQPAAARRLYRHKEGHVTIQQGRGEFAAVMRGFRDSDAERG